jgi:hypothetical protein
MLALGSSLINWGALWKIVVVALIGGGGVVIAFGFVLLTLERARTASTLGLRLAHRALAGVCAACCISAVVAGIYAVAAKPSTKPAPKPKPAGLSAALPSGSHLAV